LPFVGCVGTAETGDRASGTPGPGPGATRMLAGCLPPAVAAQGSGRDGRRRAGGALPASGARPLGPRSGAREEYNSGDGLPRSGGARLPPHRDFARGTRGGTDVPALGGGRDPVVLGGGEAEPVARHLGDGAERGSGDGRGAGVGVRASGGEPLAAAE